VIAMAKRTDLQVITSNAGLIEKTFANWKTTRLLMEQGTTSPMSTTSTAEFSTSWKATSQPAMNRRRRQPII
jgi:hypothetical protein